MSEIGYGYGSEWHLLRYLGYHRQELSAAVAASTGASQVDWLDFPFDKRRRFLDAEWEGIRFLEPSRVPEAWGRFWPSSGSQQNWDVVGQATFPHGKEWLLVEAKAHVVEMRSDCHAEKEESKCLIAKALDATKKATAVPVSCNWLEGHYQYANRLAALHFLHTQGIKARLVMIYFMGDRHSSASTTCPASEQEWESAIQAAEKHLGLTGKSELESCVHKVFLPVCPGGATHPLLRASTYGPKPVKDSERGM